MSDTSEPNRPHPGRAPETAAHVLDVARATMATARFCFLTTLDAAGYPQARLVQPLAPEPSMRVWFGTNSTTRKVQEIRADPRATVAYCDSQAGGYVTLRAQLRLVDDLTERRQRWREEWRTYFPEGPEDDDYLLIVCDPTRIEVMSLGLNVAVRPYTWRPAVLARSGATWALDGP